MKKLSLLLLTAALFLTSCANGGEYAATVGKDKVSSGEFAFYLENVKSQMSGTELSSDEDWQTNEIEGKKAIEIARERALETAVNNVAYIEVGKALGIKLTLEEKNEVKSYKERFKSQIGGEEQYKKYLKEQGIDDDFFGMLCESMLYSSKLSDKVKEENPVTDEEIHNYFEENKNELSAEYRHAKHILILTKNMTTGETLPEEEKENARLKAEEILKRACSGEDFDALAKEFSEDPGLETNPNGYVFGDGEMVAEFQDGTDALATGELGLVESDYGYHIILRMSLEEKDVADKIAALILSEKLDEQMKIWEEENEITIEINNEVVAGIN